MVKKITLPFLLELKNEILKDKVISLNITKENDNYIAEYSYSEEELYTNRNSLILMSNEIEKLSIGILLNTVHDFQISYRYDNENIILNSAFSSIMEDENYLENYNLIIESLEKAQFLVEQLEMKEFKIKDLYERKEIETKSKNKTKYVQLDIGTSIKHIIESLNRG